jgi:hypothetical protein
LSQIFFTSYNSTLIEWQIKNISDLEATNEDLINSRINQNYIYCSLLVIDWVICTTKAFSINCFDLTTSVNVIIRALLKIFL